MNDFVGYLKIQITDAIEQAIKNAFDKGELNAAGIPDVKLEIPREKGHGEFASNIAMQLAKSAGKAPRQIAEIIISNLSTEKSYIDRVECAGPGFINFYLKESWLYDALKLIGELNSDYGKINIGRGKKVMVEFISANPTGPLHMGNARGGALGDCIASVLTTAGYDVTREFYINDAGNQMETFGRSLEARFLQEIYGEDKIEFPEDGYFGDDIREHAKDYIKENGDELKNESPDNRRKALAAYALERNLARIKNDVEAYGINFDVWFHESDLHKSGAVADTMKWLQDNGFTVEKEGAVWLSADKSGLEKDEVLIKSNGLYTYFAVDIAYHRNKFLERGFERVINLLGADHHGHVARMKAAVSLLGVNADNLDVVLFQLVRLYRNGEIARMSKRTGKSISLIDLLEEVGRDAARFFFNTKASGSHLDFDLDLAVSQSNENPVFYVQYAHARICSMIKLLEAEGIKVPPISEAKLELLDKPEEKELIKKLAELPQEVALAAETLEPSRLTRYVLDVAGLFHSFYNACRVKGEEKELAEARLFLVNATGTVIRNVLSVLSISAPERM